MSARFPALGEAAVRRYLIGQCFSVVGAWTQSITLSLWMWEQTQSAWLLGLLNFLLYGPALVVSPLFGARLHPAHVRRVTLRIVGVAMALSLLLLACSLTSQLRPGLVLALAAVIGCFAAMEMPARQLLLSTVLRNKTWLVNAIALNTLVFNIGRMLGPAIAAFVFSQLGSAGGFALNALGLLLMLGCLASLPPAQASELEGPDSAHKAHTGNKGHKGQGVRAALAFARRHPLARRYLPLLAVIGLFAGSYQTLVPVLASERFGDAARYTGLFFACAGGGALLSGLMLASRHAERLRAGLRIAPWCCVLGLLGVGLSPAVWLCGLCFAVLGLSITFIATSTNAILQRESPAVLRGGMVGLYSMAFQGSMPIGHLLAGQLSSRLGVQAAFLMAATAVALGIWALALPQRDDPAE